MSTNVISCLPLVSQSGCKTKTSFCFLQEKFKKILKLFYRFFFLNFSPSISMNFPVLRGANVKASFESHKLFLIFFFENFFPLDYHACQYFSERLSLLRVQKYTTIPVTQAFLQTIFNLFLDYFLTFS